MALDGLDNFGHGRAMARPINEASDVLLVRLRDGQKVIVARAARRRNITVREYIRTLIDNDVPTIPNP